MVIRRRASGRLCSPFVFGEVGRPRSTALEGLISPRSLTPVVSIHLDCSHFNRLTVAGLLFSRTLQAPLFKAPQDLDTRLAPLPCVRSHLCCDADEPDPHLIPRDYSLPRDKYQATLKFRGFEPSLSLCACSFKPPAVQRRLLLSTAPLQPHSDVVDAPPQPYSHLSSSHLFRVLARTSIVGEGLFSSPC